MQVDGPGGFGSEVRQGGEAGRGADLRGSLGIPVHERGKSECAQTARAAAEELAAGFDANRFITKVVGQQTVSAHLFNTSSRFMS